VHGWIGLLVYAHPLGLFDLSVCWCGRTNTSDLCMGECVFVIACVCVYVYTRTPTQSDLYYLYYLYYLYLQPLACLVRYMCLLAHVCFVITFVFVYSVAEWRPAPALGGSQERWNASGGRAAGGIPGWRLHSK